MRQICCLISVVYICHSFTYTICGATERLFCEKEALSSLIGVVGENAKKKAGAFS